MASEGSDEVAANLNLTNEEKQVYGQLFRQADPESVGIVMGEVAVKFFEKTRLDSRILGEIWQIADRENRGFLTPAGFGVALRLIGHAQANREPSPNIALQQGPLPRFEGIATSAGALPSQGPLSATATGPLSAQGTGAGAQQLAAQGTGSGAGTASRVPPLAPERAAQYARVFQDQTHGEPVMSGETARRIFEKSGLGIDILGRIWTLADTEQRGALVQTEFIIAMHLLTSTKAGSLRALPNMLPAGLYEAATRGVAAAASGAGGNIGVAVGSPASPVARQQSPLGGGFGAGGIAPPPPTASISRQLTGQMTGHMRPAPPNFSNSPLGRAAAPAAPAAAPAATGSDWLITPQEKARMDPVFQNLDKTRKGYITGEEAVPFLTRSGLDEDTLAQIWDLADVNSEGHLTSDTFAVALYLIQQQRQRTDGSSALPAKLPANLVPPSLRSKTTTSPPPAAVAPTPPPPQPKSAMDDLFGLDSGASSTPSLPALAATPAGVSAAPAGLSDPFATASSPVQPSSPTRSPTVTNSFKPFVPSSSFGRSLTAQVTGDSNSSAPSAAARAAPAPPLPQQPTGMSTSSAAQNDLLGGDDGEASRGLSNDTAELANLSNQIGSLSKHTQETSAHRTTLQSELSQVNTQKKNFEQRLAQLRTMYEKEARDVRALEEQLKTSRSDTKTLQTQLATLEASYTDLQTQHQTISTQLQADQQENTNLKERIKVVSAEVNQLKPQIEKLKSEARQQKGIVAINRKQLSLGESERDKLKTEAEDLTRQNQDLARQIHNASVVSNASSASPSVASASGKNPFFRRTGSSDIMGVFSSPAQGSPSLPSASVAKPIGEQSFDDVFGPGPAAAPALVPAAPAAVAAIKPQFTGASTGSSSFSAVTAPTSETTTPGISRQGTDITQTAAPEPASQTSFLPFHSATTSPAPAAEAAVAAPPAPASVSSPAASVTSPAERASATASPVPVAPKEVPTSSPPAPEASSSNSAFGGFGATAAAATAVTAATADIAAASSTSDAASPAADADKGKSVWSQGHAAADSLSDPFTALDQQQDKAKEDFESAFASFKAARAAEPSGDDDAFEVKSPAGAAAATAPAAAKEEDPVNTDTSKAFANFHSEFPPISELNNDESDSDSDGGGFDDDFAPASPKNNQSQKAPETTPATLPEAANGKPEISKAASPELAKSTPAAESDIFSSPADVTPDVFSTPAPIPAAAPAAAPASSTNMDDIFSAPAASAPEPTPATAAAAAAPATIAPAAAPAATTASDDDFDGLDDDFDGLEEAREGSADDEFANANRSTLDDFQSAFTASPAGKQSSFGVDNSFDFSTLGASTASAGTAAAPSQGVNGTKAADPGDWFSFAADEAKPAATEAAPAAAAATESAGPSATTEDAARPATLSRLDTQNSTNDDPILRQLTAMGYSRSVALSALEKYDYNLDRAANFLASES
ncbi:hypothetical protein Sste5346_003291 [Sporothrix stenoceras]|uniref:Ef hand domain containing protein n=1 Tax=Sporothrix stenoceras TaxID=5173 RepID=A0ABR3ZES8_9PEZI